MWHSYQAYGFRIISDFSFPLTPMSEDDSSMDVVFSHFTGRPMLLAQPRSWTLLTRRELGQTHGIELYQGKDEHLLREIAGEDGVADYYLSRNGQQVMCYQDPEMPREQIWGFFLAVGMAFLLQQQGRIGLHSSAINYRGGVVAFLAFAGVGKSTMTVEFVRHGYPLITDDILPVSLQDGHVLAGPGCSLVKMWPETAAQFVRDWFCLPRVAPGAEKRWVCLTTIEEAYTSGVFPLTAVYLLEPQQTTCHQPTITLLSSMEAAVVLGTQTFLGPHMELDRTSRLRMYSEIASRVRVKRLTYPWGLERLSTVRAAIIDDLDRMI